MNHSELLVGAGFLLSTPVALAALVGVLAARWQRAPAMLLLGGLALGATTAIWLPDGARGWAPAPLLLAGVLAMSRARLAPAAGAALAVACGVAAGIAAQLRWATPLEVIGGIAAMVLLAAAAAVALRLAAGRRWPVPASVRAWAARVVGAWVFVLGALLLLLGARGA